MLFFFFCQTNIGHGLSYAHGKSRNKKAVVHSLARSLTLTRSLTRTPTRRTVSLQRACTQLWSDEQKWALTLPDTHTHTFRRAHTTHCLTLVSQSLASDAPCGAARQPSQSTPGPTSCPTGPPTNSHIYTWVGSHFIIQCSQRCPQTTRCVRTCVISRLVDKSYHFYYIGYLTLCAFVVYSRALASSFVEWQPHRSQTTSPSAVSAGWAQSGDINARMKPL